MRGNELFINNLKIQLSQIPYEEGSYQFGRVIYHSDMLRKLDEFADANFAACPKVRALPAYFRKLHDNDYFYIIEASFPVINRQIALVWLHARSLGYNNRKAWEQYLFTEGRLKTRFDYYSFGFDNIKVYAGEIDKSKRICRFCHGVTQEHQYAQELKVQGRPIVMFGEKTNAHAISDALGNKNLFCVEECVTCNNQLSKIENNFIALMDWRRAMMGVKNKYNTLPNVFGKEAALRINDDGTQILYVDETVARDRTEKDILNIRLNNQKVVTDQGIYKALCKYAISLMPSKYLSHFSQTIDWICGRLSDTKLPEVQITYKMPFVSQPILDLYFKTEETHDLPLCTAILRVCDTCYLYILPLADTDGARFKAKGSLENHWIPFRKAFPAHWESKDLSDYRPSTPWIDIDVSVNASNIKFVPHGDSLLKQPISGATMKETPVEHHFPPFDVNSIKCTGTEVLKFNILYSGPIPSDALRNAMVVVDKLCCTINLIENKAEFSSSFTVKSPTGKQPYFDYEFVSYFELCGAERHITITEEYLALDYQLRDALFRIGCFVAEYSFKQRLQHTPYAICSLQKTLCNDERIVLCLNYQLMTTRGVYNFKDTDIHNNPFDI